MDIRSENETGKLLFKWDPDTDIISVACKDAVYDVRLIRSLEKKTYRVIGKRSKKNAPRASLEYNAVKDSAEKDSTSGVSVSPTQAISRIKKYSGRDLANACICVKIEVREVSISRTTRIASLTTIVVDGVIGSAGILF